MPIGMKFLVTLCCCLKSINPAQVDSLTNILIDYVCHLHIDWNLK